jgi:hypothetical protein
VNRRESTTLSIHQTHTTSSSITFTAEAKLLVDAQDKTTLKNVGNRWQPGQSGNPGGRNKTPKSIADLLRDSSEDALQTIIKIMKDKNASHAVRAYCAIHVLDRCYGKPSQQTTVLVGAVKRRAVDLSDDELATIIAGGKLPPPRPALPAVIDGTATEISDRSCTNDSELEQHAADVERQVADEIEISATLSEMRDSV